MTRTNKELRDYQRSLIPMVDAAISKGLYYFLIVWTMRAGKTHAICKVLHHMHRNKPDTVGRIVCPPGVIKTWEQELAECQVPGKWSVISNGLLSTRSIKEGLTSDCVVVDEIHEYKNYSKRTRSLLKLVKHSKFRLGCTGTVCDRTVLELYYPLRVLANLQRGQCNDFVSRTRELWEKDWGICRNPRSTHPEFVLRDDLKSKFYGELRDFSNIHDPQNVRCPDLETVRFTLTPQQKLTIGKLHTRSTCVVGGVEYVTKANQSLSQINNKCKQVVSGFMYIGDTQVKLLSNKWYALLKLIRNKKLRNIVVWYWYDEERETLRRVLSNVGKVAIYKETGLDQLRSGDADFLLAHPHSAGTGQDISFAQAGVFVSVPTDFVAFKQAQYRIADQAKTHKVNYVLLSNAEVCSKVWERYWEKEREFHSVYELGGTTEQDINR